MSPTAVTCLKVGKGTAPLPIVLFTLTTFARLKRLKPSIISSRRRLEPNAIVRDTRRSSADVPQTAGRSSKHGKRSELRPTPAGRSLKVVSLLLSAPVTTLNGSADATE